MERAVQRATMTGPLAGLVVSVSGAQLWTAGNNSYRGTLLKRSRAVRSGHPPKVYRAEVTGRMVNTSKRE